MGAPKFLSSIFCELRIMEARNTDYFNKSSKGSFFVRYYLSSGNKKKKIELNTREISSKQSNIIWNESFSLDCLGTEDSINKLKEESIVFELRWRNNNKASVFKMSSKSCVLGRAEIPWRVAFESEDMEMERWVMMELTNKNKVDSDIKPPSLRLGMKVGAGGVMVERENKKLRKKRDDDNEYCGCRDGDGYCSCADYELLALVAALDAL